MTTTAAVTALILDRSLTSGFPLHGLEGAITADPRRFLLSAMTQSATGKSPTTYRTDKHHEVDTGRLPNLGQSCGDFS